MAKPRGYWTYERCKETMLKCKTKSEMSEGLSNAIKRNKWHELLNLIPNKNKPNGYWNYENSKLEALKYNSIKELNKNSKGAYLSIIKNNWKELLPLKRSNLKWTYEKCKEEALKYTKISDFNRKHACKVIKNNKWNELLSHLYNKNKPIGYYNNYNICKIEALKYNRKLDFAKGSPSAYKYVNYNKWNELTYHMIDNKLD